MQTENPDIQAVAFDYGGVLAYFIDGDSLCHLAHAAGASVDEFTRAFWEHRARYDSGDLDGPAYWSAVLRDCEVGPADAETVTLLEELDALGWSRMNLAVIRWVHALRGHGYRTLIISNMAPSTFEVVVRGKPWMRHFEHAVISGWMGVNKPDARIFEKASRDMALDPAAMLFLDDAEHNVRGAEAAGLHALQFTDATSFAEALRARYPAIPTAGLGCGDVAYA